MIGNPPYVRQEQIKALKPALRKAYRAFDGVADLYVYFYELGLRLLRPGGHAKKFFPGADVFPCVIVARRPDGSDEPQETEVCQMPRDVVRLDRVSQQVSEMAFLLPRASFTSRHGSWTGPRSRRSWTRSAVPAFRWRNTRAPSRTAAY